MATMTVSPDASSLSSDDESALTVMLEEEELDDDSDAVPEPRSSPSAALTGADSGAATAAAPEWGALWFVCALLGLGFLVPWHAVITAADYFVAVFPSRAVQFDVVVAYSVPNALMFVFAVRWADRIPVRLRIVGGFVIFFLIMLVLPLLDFLGLLGGLYVLLLGLVALIGIVDGWVQSGIYAYASLLSARHVVAVQTGMGVSGLVVSVARILSKAVLGSSVGPSEAHIYFGVSAAAMLACVISFEATRSSPHSLRAIRILAKSLPAAPSRGKELSDLSRIDIFRRVWAPCLFNFATLTVTIAAYPGVVSEVERSHKLSGGWLTLSFITLYNLCDLIAKVLPRWPIFLERVTPRIAYSIAVLRVILIPLLVFCVRPLLLASLAWPFVLVVVLALTNGYLGSYFLAHTPSLVEEHERDAAMTMVIAALVFGITAGSFVGYGLSVLLR